MLIVRLRTERESLAWRARLPENPLFRGVDCWSIVWMSILILGGEGRDKERGGRGGMGAATWVSAGALERDSERERARVGRARVAMTVAAGQPQRAKSLYASLARYTRRRMPAQNA